ncbi:LiaI-LiaF-like domain-containing protein [Clostridium algidicarnis]|uniref:DUF5668 domain-containing protein n=2 Tax=Clostridium algidicarnis TaxID=37659 RepID=A0A2S6FWG4_9CLOT|nr:DUF5668 domain-containing protein [Clostridium algidicarnis]MBB6632030.1 hypothetical protein [Clostridium algidicarnis]MBB6697300.1 hypothetical protein [Clostridium algidicarnis]MBU3194565.1 hypothetical protein [Clostridium algidicarnis]MBU3202570.1 hypothetical protein [Clostridium algidicarnis]MBU3206960.1 hypothetical protein [Clostridium algidicarnis]
MKKGNIIFGIILILLGLSALINRIFFIDILSFRNLWPLFLLVPGILFEVKYFETRKDPGMLVPGGILTTLGTLFLIENISSFHFKKYIWPLYPLSVAIGLFQLYWFGNREKGLLIPIFILTIVSVMSILNQVFNKFFYWMDYKLLFPVILIGIGLYVLFNEMKR